MRYKDFYVRITPDKYIPRVDKKGRDILCEGFLIQVFADETERIEIDNFSAVFVFDIFGMYGEKTETLYGTGDKLFIQWLIV